MRSPRKPSRKYSLIIAIKKSIGKHLLFLNYGLLITLRLFNANYDVHKIFEIYNLGKFCTLPSFNYIKHAAHEETNVTLITYNDEQMFLFGYFF